MDETLEHVIQNTKTTNIKLEEIISYDFATFQKLCENQSYEKICSSECEYYDDVKMLCFLAREEYSHGREGEEDMWVESDGEYLYFITKDRKVGFVNQSETGISWVKLYNDICVEATDLELKLLEENCSLKEEKSYLETFLKKEQAECKDLRDAYGGLKLLCNENKVLDAAFDDVDIFYSMMEKYKKHLKKEEMKRYWGKIAKEKPRLANLIS